ncbi:MAG: hypothetical protein IPK60_06745 [Sandaracinaceae bacterium]|nr:hypothetical protein [Sandaracinaceae bacterium]
MDNRSLNRISLVVIACAAALPVVAWVALGLSVFIGAEVGAVLSVANWFSLRYIIKKVQTGTTRTQTGLMMLLIGKMFALLAIVGVLLINKMVNATGFAIGVSSLVLGVLLGSLGAARDLAESDLASPTMEER